MFKKVVLVIILAFGTALARGEDAPKFKPLVLPDAIHFVQVFSEDNQVATLIFDNFLAATRADKGIMPDATVKSFIYCLQPDITKEAVVHQTVRGFFSTQNKASASLVINAGGKSTLVDLEKACESKEETKARHQSLYEMAKSRAKHQGFSVDEPPAASNDYTATFKSTVAPGTPLQATILMIVDRLPGDDSTGALLTVDTIDMEISQE